MYLVSLGVLLWCEGRGLFERGSEEMTCVMDRGIFSNKIGDDPIKLLDGLNLECICFDKAHAGVGRIIICCMICLWSPVPGPKMCCQNCLKSSLYSIKQSPEIILRAGAKHRFSVVPQTSSQFFHKILLIRTILTV